MYIKNTMMHPFILTTLVNSKKISNNSIGQVVGQP